MMKRMQRDTYASTRKADSGSQRRSHIHSINVGEEFDTTIEELGHNGDGLVHINEYTVFVKNTTKGEKVRIKVKKVKETIAWADRL
jgi:predicted RNA-binding protein with TRAM domain